MKARVRKYEESSSIEMLLLREKLGLGRYRKSTKRDEGKRKILLGLGLKKIEEKERNDFVLIGLRRRKVSVFS